MATATATILFADVEGSTEVRSRIGESAADRLFLDHEKLMVGVVERNGGRVLKKAGDGVMAAFDSSSDAVQAAIDMQRAVARRISGIRIRVGVAAGDVSWEGDDCFGLPVVVAARLEAAAEGGQILVSQVVRWLAGERSGARFETVGALDLKGLPEAVEAFSVAWEPTAEEMLELETLPLPPALAHAGTTSFVGRDREWAVLNNAWKQARGGTRQIVLLGGEPGAGKTRLASEFARRCHDDGAAVVFGSCDSQLLIPYQPWVHVLEHLLRHLPDEDIPPAISADLAVLHPYLPRLERPAATALPVTSFGDSDAERYRLFSAIDMLLAHTASRWPLVVMIDDLHWGGSHTLALLSYLARSATASAMLLVATFRDVADDATDALASTLADLRRVDHVERVRVEGLDESSVAALMETATGQALDAELRELAADVTRRSRGNAFFVGELWRHLVASGAVANVGGRWEVRGSLDTIGVPESVREVVSDRLGRLDFSVRRLAELVAVAGTRVDLALVRTAADIAESDVTARLDELVAAGLLEVTSRPQLTYQFTHAIVRDTVADAIPAGARLQLHLRVAEALEMLHEADRRPVLSELARHYIEAADLGVTGKAIYYGRRAAEQATESAASDDAVALLETVHALTTPGTRARAEVLLALGEAQHKLGWYEKARNQLKEVFELGKQLGDARLAAEAAVGFEHALQTPGLSGEPAIAMIEEAIELLGDDGSSLRARLEAGLAEALYLAGRADECRERLKSALALADASDDVAKVVVLQAGMIMSDDAAEVLRYGRRLDEIAERIGHTWGRLYATVNELRAYVQLGDLDQAKVVFDRHATMATRFQVLWALIETYAFDHIFRLAEGRFAESELAAAGGFEQAAPTEPAAAGVYGMQMFAIRREQGRLREVVPVLESVARNGDAGGAWRPGLAMLYAEVGMLEEARALFHAIAADGFASLPRDAVWPATVSFLADACVAIQDKEAAAKLYEEMLPLAGRNLQVALTTCLGPADRALGGLATVLGWGERADDHFATAVALADRAKSPVWRARALHDWAGSLFLRGDREAAQQRCGEALALAEPLGMMGIVESCRDLTSQHPRLSVVADVASKPDAWPAGLSGREVDVLKLVAGGCSNREIGERLSISANTAANHVRSILQKTACSTRAEAAAFAARNQLV